MKPIISLADYELLKSLIQNSTTSKEIREDKAELVTELRNAEFVGQLTRWQKISFA